MVRDEASPIRFLRACHGDPWQAAARLCQNFTFRRQTYGEEDWLKPLRLHDGALTPQDVAVLRAGVVALLTPPPDAKDLRQVIVVNFTRALGLSYHEHNGRIFFYLCNTGVNEYSQTHGLNVLIVLNSSGLKVNPGNGRLFQVTHTVSAFTLHQVIMANDPHDTKVTLAHLCGLTMRRLAEKFWGGSGRLTNVSASTEADTLERLEALGLHPSTIPTQLGGTFSYERDFKEWLALRLVQEQSGIRVSPAMNASVSPPIRPVSSERLRPPTAVVTRANSTDNTEQSNLTPPQGQSAIRKRNCEYSKRHYYKKKQQMEELQTEYEKLQRERVQLHKTQIHLENLWQQAQALVAQESFGAESWI